MTIHEAFNEYKWMGINRDDAQVIYTSLGWLDKYAQLGLCFYVEFSCGNLLSILFSLKAWVEE